MLSAENGVTVGRVEFAPDYGRWNREAFGGRVPGPMEVDPRKIAVHLSGQSPTDRAAEIGVPYKEKWRSGGKGGLIPSPEGEEARVVGLHVPQRDADISVHIGTIPAAPHPSGDNTFTRPRRVDPYEMWHMPPLTVPANDNKRPVMIGLTGKRNVGKSTFANVLEQEFGWNKVHAFESGKVAAEAYFKHILRYMSNGDDIARRMVYGDLKDKPSEYLPGNAKPRDYMERSGHFHGVELGTEWTLAMELRAALAMHPNAPIVVESVVYEAPWFRKMGGKVVRLIRPDFEGPVGVKSDSAQAELVADYTYSCVSSGEVEFAARSFAQRMQWAA